MYCLFKLAFWLSATEQVRQFDEMFHFLPNLYTIKNWTVDVTLQTPVFNVFGLSFHPLVRCIRHSRNDLGRWRVIRIIGPANFRQIERSCVWLESPGFRIEKYFCNWTKGYCFMLCKKCCVFIGTPGIYYDANSIIERLNIIGDASTLFSSGKIHLFTRLLASGTFSYQTWI